MNGQGFLETLKRYDYTFFGIATVIFIIGVANLYSATHASNYLNDLYLSQLMWFTVALFAGVCVSLLRPKHFMRVSYVFYFFVTFLLVLVLVLGVEGMGATRWIYIAGLRFQPSEFMKIGVILALARWFSKRGADSEMGMKELLVPLVLVLVPVGLVVVEPDLGTGLLILLIFSFIAFYRRLRWKIIGILALMALISGGAMYQFGLKDYQKKRIVSFLNPNLDTQGSGYNAIQSKIAIGSGQLFGKGFKKSSQASLSYLPENHTDFVFSIFNEEHGFVGALFLMCLYLALFLRLIWLASVVPRVFDAIVPVGILGIFFWHTFINIGMVTGILPVVGLPLPLMSYGGSSLMTFCLCCGIATSISNSRNLFQ
jgi:rod shape determining protein RodA